MGSSGESPSIGGHARSMTVQFGLEHLEGLGESEPCKAAETHVKKATINDTMAAFTLGSPRYG